jgi:hypothetical protein
MDTWALVFQRVVAAKAPVFTLVQWNDALLKNSTTQLDPLRRELGKWVLTQLQQLQDNRTELQRANTPSAERDQLAVWFSDFFSKMHPTVSVDDNNKKFAALESDIEKRQKEADALVEQQTLLQAWLVRDLAAVSQQPRGYQLLADWEQRQQRVLYVPLYALQHKYQEAATDLLTQWIETDVKTLCLRHVQAAYALHTKPTAEERSRELRNLERQSLAALITQMLTRFLNVLKTGALAPDAPELAFEQLQPGGQTRWLPPTTNNKKEEAARLPLQRMSGRALWQGLFARLVTAQGSPVVDWYDTWGQYTLPVTRSDNHEILRVQARELLLLPTDPAKSAQLPFAPAQREYLAWVIDELLSAEHANLPAVLPTPPNDEYGTLVQLLTPEDLKVVGTTLDQHYKTPTNGALIQPPIKADKVNIKFRAPEKATQASTPKAPPAPKKSKSPKK